MASDPDPDPAVLVRGVVWVWLNLRRTGLAVPRVGEGADRKA